MSSRPTPPLRPRPGTDRPLVGIGYALGAGITFSLADAAAKELALALPPQEVSWMRWVGYLAAVLPVMIATRGGVLRSGSPRLQALRAVCLLGSSLLFTTGLIYLPLASATTINFVSPLLVTALSIPLLGERVGARRWAAVVVGLVGVLIVIRPGSGTFGWPTAFPILSAACWAVGVILTRRLGGIDGPWTAMTFTAVIGFCALSAVVPADFVVPDTRQVVIGIVMAALATAGQFFTVLAYVRAPASIIAPFVYVMLIWSSALGYLFFGSVPDGWTWVGAAIIAASGIYTAHRERSLARAAARRLSEASGFGEPPRLAGPEDGGR